MELTAVIKAHPEYLGERHKSDVLKFLLEDNCSLVVRPSGTEPKLKIYISVSAENKEMAEYFGMSVSDFIEQYNDMSIEEYAKDSLKRQCVQDLLVEAKNVTVTE